MIDMEFYQREYRIWDKKEQAYKYNIDLKWFIYDLLKVVQDMELEEENDYLVINDLEQNTGWKDTLGNKLYQGDIVKTNTDEWAVIVLDQVNCALVARTEFEDYSLMDFLCCSDCFYIYGNVHQNPNLLVENNLKYGVEDV